MEKKFKLPNTSQLLLSHYYSMINKPNETVVNPPSDVAHWLCLFCIYDALFCSEYDHYIREPDDVVETYSRLENSDFAAIRKTQARANKITGIDIKATCHLILITINKRFVRNLTLQEKQTEIYLSKRSKRAYAAMDWPSGQLVVSNDFWIDLSGVLRNMPKLKKMLFLFCYQNQEYPELSVACNLLAYTSMSLMKCMEDFIKAPLKTQAHSDTQLLKEINNFLDIVKKKKEDDGVLWPYHKIFHPTDTDLDIKNFPSLSVAAIEYMKKFQPEKFKFMHTPNHDQPLPDLKEKATTVDERASVDHLYPIEFSEYARKGAAAIGLNLDKLIQDNLLKRIELGMSKIDLKN